MNSSSNHTASRLSGPVSPAIFSDKNDSREQAQQRPKTNKMRIRILRSRFQKSVSSHHFGRSGFGGIKGGGENVGLAERVCGSSERLRERKAKSEKLLGVLKELLSEQERNKRKVKGEIEKRLSDMMTPYHPDFGAGFPTVDFNDQKMSVSHWPQLSSAILGGSHEGLSNYLKRRSLELQQQQQQSRRNTRKSTICMRSQLLPFPVPIPPSSSTLTTPYYTEPSQRGGLGVRRSVQRPKLRLDSIKRGLDSLNKEHTRSYRFLEKIQKLFGQPHSHHSRSRASQMQITRKTVHVIPKREHSHKPSRSVDLSQSPERLRHTLVAHPIRRVIY